MLTLQNCQIESLDMLSAYFDFRELYDLLLSEDAYLFSEFAQSYLVASPVKIKLFGINDTQGCFNEHTGALRCAKKPELCLEMELFENRPVFQRCEGTKYVKVCNVIELIEYVYLNSQEIYKEVHGVANDPLNFKELKDAVYTVISDITESGKRLFSYEAATEFYLYLLLHMQSAVLPDKRESLEVLRNDLDRLCPVSYNQMKNRETIKVYVDTKEDTQSACPMRYYTGKQPNKEPLSIVKLDNPHDKEITITITDTILSRRIPPKGFVYAIRKGADFVSFIPRFRLNGEMALMVKNGTLSNVWQGDIEKVSASIQQPVSWAQSSEYGTFIIDQKGRLDQSMSWPDTIPDKEIVYVDAFGLDYCMLLADGTVVSKLLKTGWKDMISVHLGLNSAIAINDHREPVLGNGTVIDHFSAAEVRAGSGHYICLSAQGQIVTDSNLRLEETVYGVAVCDKGYVVAFADGLSLISFDNHTLRNWKVQGVTEVEASKTRISYYDAYSENVKSLEY